MRQYRSYLLIVGLLAIALIITITASLFRKSEIHKEYPSILMDDSINEIIESKPSYKGFKYTPSAMAITTQTGHKYTINAHINPNFGDGSVGINDVTEPGDRIFKKANNDTIYVYKNKAGDVNIYYFIWTAY